MSKELNMTDFMCSIDGELASIMHELKVWGFDSANIEIYPHAFSTMATIDLRAGGNDYPVVVKNDGSLIIGRDIS